MPDFTPTGPAVLVNVTPANDQYEIATARLTGGGRVEAWIDFTTGEVRYDVKDTVGNSLAAFLGTTSFRADDSVGEKRAPTIIPDLEGGFFLSWTMTQPGFGTSIVTRHFGGLGQILGGEVITSLGATDPFATSDGVMLPNGGLALGYWSGAGGQDVSGRLFDSFGNPAAVPFTINTTTAGQQAFPTLVPTDTGFRAYWLSQAGTIGTVFQQQFDSNGNKIGSETVVGPATVPLISGNASVGPNTAVEELPGDGLLPAFIGVFVRPGTNGGPDQLVATFDSPNAPSQTIVIADVPSGINGRPSITKLPGGGFVVTWILNNPGGPDALLGRGYDASSGTPVPFGDAFIIAPDARFQIASATTRLVDGQVIFAWDGAGLGDGQGVFTRIFQLTGLGNVPTQGNDELWDPAQQVMAPPGAAGIAGTGASNIDGLAGDDVIRGYDGDDVLTGNDGNDRLFGGLGNDVMNGGAGNDFGLFENPLDSFTGGDGTDTAGVQGNFIGTLGIDATTEVVLVAAGNDTRFGDYSNNSYDYTLTLGVLVVQQLTFQAADLRIGEDLSLNAAALQGQLRVFAGAGLTVVTGGVGSDGVFFGTPAAYDPANSFIAGGNVDSLAFRGNYVGGTALVFGNASFSGVEVVALLSGLTNEFGGFIHPAGFDYALTMADGNVLAGQTLDINGNKLGALESVNVNASAELDGAYRFFLGAGNDTVVGSAGADLIFGNLGADTLDGGGGADTYAYRSTAESTAASQDAITLGAGDKLDLSRIDANTGTPENDAFAFIGSAAFGNVAGQLRVAGGLIQADVNGDGVADLQIAFTGTPPAAPDFVL